MSNNLFLFDGTKIILYFIIPNFFSKNYKKKSTSFGDGLNLLLLVYLTIHHTISDRVVSLPSAPVNNSIVFKVCIFCVIVISNKYTLIYKSVKYFKNYFNLFFSKSFSSSVIINFFILLNFFLNSCLHIFYNGFFGFINLF
jgi:hypothetical protein